MTQADPWTEAYGPLRGRGLLVQLAALIVVEIALFASYRVHEAGFHWATHFLVGLTAASLWNLAWLVVKAAPARWPLGSVLAAHLFAMAPDLVFRWTPHAAWMDVFLAHISSHYVPGGTATWLAIALAAAGAYAIALSRWLGARRREADAGMAPGIGIGGGAVVRAQADPRTTPLAHVRAGPDGPPEVVLLHGLPASHSVWSAVTDALAEHGVPAVAPDLLGFGGSRRIGSRFTLDDHAAALRRLLDEFAARRLVVVGHSWGCAVAVRLAETSPAAARLVLVSPPAFHDAAEARGRLAERDWLARKVLEGSPLASLSCGLMCLLRPALARLGPRLAPELPPAVAREGVEHSWPAYRDALESLFVGNPLPDALARPRLPTTVVLADEDAVTPGRDVLDHPHAGARVVEFSGDHYLPLTAAEPLAAVIAHEAAALHDDVRTTGG